MRKTIQKNRFKIIANILLVATLFIFTPQQVEAQFFKKLAKKAKAKIEREADKRAERRVNKKIDKEFDKAEDVLDGKKKDKKGKNKNGKSNEKDVNNEQVDDANESKRPNVVWSKFDFIPGDTVIFEDSPSADEENGEFPSRWDLFKGGAEIAEVDGEPVITFITAIGNMHSKGIVPYLKNSKVDYLPEVFTIEFDAYFNPNVYNERYYVTLHDRKNQSRSGISQLTIFVNQLRMGTSEGDLIGKERTNRDKIGGWRHISIAYTKGKLKAYCEDQRLINIPHLEGNPTGITLSGGSEGMYIKNIRIAKGGVKYYDRVLSEGKIIVNGIKFDVNKATLKSESMGPINKIYQLMQKQPELNFSVEGHTDSDGDDANNQKLSEARGKSVMNKLIEMGISANRLKSNGFGESKPLDNNSTPEGKANNRRVEFVKFSGTTSTNSNNKTGSTFDSSSKTDSDNYKSFKRGEKTIFNDELSSVEKVHEVPSKWREYNFNKSDDSEIVKFKGENLIRLGEREGISPIVLKNEKDYLPDNFTLEFDASFSANSAEQRYWLKFYDQKSQNEIVEHSTRTFDITLTTFGVTDDYNEATLDNNDMYQEASNLVWRHISISYSNNNLDVYYDGQHLLNNSNIEGNLIGITLGRSEFSDNNRYLKNIHLATNIQ